MKVKSENLIAELLGTTKKNIVVAAALKAKSDDQLNWRANETSWSILECLEHLNLYGAFYLPEIERVIQKARSKRDVVFKSGFLGNFFAENMLPKEKSTKMKTFKDKNPLNSSLNRATIDRFIQQQNKMLELLERAGSISLNKEKTHITLAKWIKLKIGDTFRFVIYHNTRHLKQIERTIELANAIE